MNQTPNIQDADDYSVDLRNIISVPSSTLSVLGCLYIFISFFSNNNGIRTKILYKLVFNLSFVDFWRVIAGLYIPPSALQTQQSLVCNIEAFVVWFTDLSSLLIATAFSIKIYNLVVRDKSVEKCTSLAKTYFLCYGIPFVVTTIFLIFSLNESYPIFGYNKCFCLVDNSRKENIAYLGISFYGPFVILAVFNTVMYYKTSSYIKKFDPTAKKPLKFMLYPLLLFLGATPALIGWIYELIKTNHDHVTNLYYTNVALAQCKGLWSFAVFILTTDSKKGFRLYFNLCHPIAKEHRELEETLE